MDRRTRRYRWKKITAIVEPTYHDNAVQGSDQSEPPEHTFSTYDQKEEISVAEALDWASALPYAATLYFYDLGGGMSVAGTITSSRSNWFWIATISGD
jgi:hypothetical protein